MLIKETYFIIPDVQIVEMKPFIQFDNTILIHSNPKILNFLSIKLNIASCKGQTVTLNAQKNLQQVNIISI